MFWPNKSITRTKIGPQQTSKPRPEPVVVSIEEPVQDPGENCAVVNGGEPRRRQGVGEKMRRKTATLGR